MAVQRELGELLQCPLTITAERTARHCNQGLDAAFPEDFAEAAHWYGEAADQGSARGLFNLGCLYGHGLGVEKNYEKAADLYQQAADQGFVSGQYNLRDLPPVRYGARRRLPSALSRSARAALAIS